MGGEIIITSTVNTLHKRKHREEEECFLFLLQNLKIKTFLFLTVDGLKQLFHRGIILFFLRKILVK